MTKFALCLLLAACADQPEGVSGEFENVRYEAVHVGDAVAARFTTLSGDPIATAFDEGAAPAGWEDEGADIDPRAYASVLGRAIAQVGDSLAPDEVDALVRAAEPWTEKGTQNAFTYRTWYASCVPSPAGDEGASMPLFNGGSVAERLKIGRYYGVRSGATYSSSYETTLGRNARHTVSFHVYNGANILYFRYAADPIDFIYREFSISYCN
jgi:hypothetical protein